MTSRLLLIDPLEACQIAPSNLPISTRVRCGRASSSYDSLTFDRSISAVLLNRLVLNLRQLSHEPKSSGTYNRSLSTPVYAPHPIYGHLGGTVVLDSDHDLIAKNLTEAQPKYREW